MKQIIALSGAGNSGKSTALNFLIDKLSEESIFRKDDTAKNTPSRVAFLHKETGLKIGITTPGDNNREITKNFEFFKNYDCDICITATRTRSVTIDKTIACCEEHHIHLIQLQKQISMKWEKIQDKVQGLEKHETSNRNCCDLLYNILLMSIQRLKN